LIRIIMKVLIFSLVVTLIGVVLGHRRPFTVFHPKQAEYVHGPRARFIGPVYPRFQPSQNQLVRQYSLSQSTPSFRSSTLTAFNSPLGSSAFSSSFSGNIVEQTRAQADAAKEILKSVQNNKIAAPSIEKSLQGTGCLNTLDDAIEAVEESAKLVEDNGPELVYLVATVKQLEGEKDIIKLTKSSAKILRILDDLTTLTSAPTKCNASPQQRIEAFKALSEVLDDVLNKNYRRLPTRTRQSLQYSSQVSTQVTILLESMQKSLSSFDCVEGKDNSAAVYETIVDIMENLAVLFEGLDEEERAKKVRNQGAFIKSIVDTFDDLNLDPGIKCGQPWNYESLAQDLDDLAGIIESVGAEKLSNELGLELDFK